MKNFFTRRALQLKGHLGTHRTLEGETLQGYLDAQDTGAIEHFRYSSTRRTLGTLALKAFGHLGTQALGSSGTRRALGKSGSQALGHSWHFI